METFTVTHSNFPQVLQTMFLKIERLEAALLSKQPEPGKPKENLLNPELLQLLAEHGIKWTLSTLNKECCLGKIPYRTLSKRRVFNRTEIIHWIEQGRPNAGKLQAKRDLQSLHRK